MGDHHVERVGRKLQPFGIHHRELLDMVEILLTHPFARPLQHCVRNVDAGDAQVLRIERQADAGADAHFEHPTSNPLRRVDRQGAPGPEHPAEHEVVNGRPPVIGLGNLMGVHGICPGCHGFSDPPLVCGSVQHLWRLSVTVRRRLDCSFRTAWMKVAYS